MSRSNEDDSDFGVRGSVEPGLHSGITPSALSKNNSPIATRLRRRAERPALSDLLTPRMRYELTRSALNPLWTGLGLQPLANFQKMCSRRRQSAPIKLRERIWRELTFAATSLSRLLQRFNRRDEWVKITMNYSGEFHLLSPEPGHKKNCNSSRPVGRRIRPITLGHWSLAAAAVESHWSQWTQVDWCPP